MDDYAKYCDMFTKYWTWWMVYCIEEYERLCKLWGIK